MPTNQKIQKTAGIPQEQVKETNPLCRDSADHSEDPEDC